ncbi:MAG: branched-chain amino acid ABC transporter permease, partial [Xanthobacteraceae bacterium]
GMVIFIVLRELLANYGTYYLILLGLIAIVIMLKAPAGVWGLMIQRYNLQLFPVARRLTLARRNDSSKR